VVDNNNKNSFFEELRRRRLFRSMAAYVVVAWLLVQIADTIFPIYEAPDWMLRALVTLLMVGFTPAMIFAWLYNITTDGLEITEDNKAQSKILSSTVFRVAIGGVTVILTGIAVWWVWTGYLAGAAVSKNADQRPLPNPVVAVVAFQNLSGDAELDWIGEGLANLVRTNLAQSRHVVVVSRQRWASIVRQTETDADPYEAAKTAGINYVFSGEFISAPAGLYLAARLTDLVNGTERASDAIPALTPETMLGNGYRLSILAKQGLQIPHTESVDSFAADFVVNNMTAYEAYVAGLGFFRNFEYEQAEQAFGAALKLAPEFEIARYRLAHVYMSTGRQSEALETIKRIPADAPLTQRERLYVDAAAAFFRHDLDASIATYKQLLDEYPYEVEARQFLAELYFQNYQENLAVQELEELARQEPENEFIWGSMGTYLVLSGRLAEAQQPLETYLALAAEKAHPLTMLGDLYRQRGNYEQAADYYGQALVANPEFAEARRGRAQLLAVLGESESATAIWRNIVDDKSIPADERIYAAFDYSSVLRSQGQFRSSLQPLTQLESEIQQERIREPMSLSTQAMSYIELGEVDRAEQLIGLAIERNESSAPTRYLFARGLLELARGDFDAVARTATEIRSHAMPPEDPDRTEDRAAAYLEGVALATQGDAAAGASRLREALAIQGYDYAVYELGLATALESADDLEEALRFAELATQYRNPSEIRLDFEFDRARALLLQARIHQRLGNDKKSRQLAKNFLDRWSRADLPHPLYREARELAGLPQALPGRAND
jgi:tetratricopeptide (TPR) repeat protein